MQIDLLADDAPKRQPIDLLAETGSKQPSKGWLQNALDYESGLGLGLDQGVGDVAASIGNFPGYLYQKFTGKEPYHIPHPSLREDYPKGTAGEYGSKIGEAIGGFAAPGGIAFKVLKAFNNPVARVLAGSVAGGVAGAASDEQDRIGSGIAGAALGAAIPAIGGAYKGLKSLTSKEIAQKISSDKSAAKQLAKKEYGKLFSEAANRGINSVEVPKIDIGRIKGNSLPRYHEALLEHFKNPTIESAHWSQSDLGALKRHMEKLDATRGLTSSEHKTLKEVMSAQEKIKKSMFQDEHKDLEEQYNKLSGKYKETVVPYDKLKNLTKYEEGNLLPKDLIKILYGNKEFQATMAKKYPQIKWNQALKSDLAKKIYGGAATGIGLKEGYDLVK